MSVAWHLLIHPYSRDLGLERVARLVEECAPDIRAVVVRDRPLRWRGLALARRPTLVWSITPLRRLRPWRGTICQGRNLTKAEEMTALDAAGVPVPRWFLLNEERDVAEQAVGLGEYVVLKPNVGFRGALVRITRASRVCWKPKYAERGGLIVQEFVYTGRWPVAYRATTLFGEVLFCMRTESPHAKPPLEHPGDWRGGKGQPVSANSRGGTWTLADDEDVLALARAAARAFPDIGLLGVDIVRDAGTGKCAVLEVNATGYTWHFTSERGLSIQRDHGIHFESQFDGIHLAARVLAEETRRRAT